MKFEIKHRYNNEILFSCEGDSWKFAIELAIRSKTDLSHADLSSTNLRSADLRSADLSFANLSSANLRSANLSFANLRSADLSFANLSFANLSFANLRSADLSFANLSSTNLRSADLRSADLSFANLSSANLSFANLMVFQFQRHWAYYTFDGSLRIGCIALPISEWEIGFEEIGKKESYTDEQILMYGSFIKICVEHFKRNN